MILNLFQTLRTFFLITLMMFLGVTISPAQSLLENGSFDDPEDPLKGWITDYEFTGNSHYVGNKAHVTIGREGSKKSVALFADENGEGGVKMESEPFPLEPGYKYTGKLDIKTGHLYRVYFMGYKWKPGIRPHDNPTLGELRPVYKSRAITSDSSSWSREKFELPAVKLSDAAKKHLKQVRFLTMYIFFVGGGAVDDVELTKTRDRDMDF
ncbi:MAG: hypothetical protein AAFY98_01010 [Verrucomicrobiota bacterium]